MLFVGYGDCDVRDDLCETAAGEFVEFCTFCLLTSMFRGGLSARAFLFFDKNATHNSVDISVVNRASELF